MKILPALVLSALALSLGALEIPKSSKFDKRITYASYNADDVFLIKVRSGYVSMLKFSEDERIVNIASGFSNGWDLAEKDNFLFIKAKPYAVDAKEQQAMFDESGEAVEFEGASVIQPNPEDWKTNLIVTTTKRVYVFDLQLEEENSKTNVNYKVDFVYPSEIKREKEAKKIAQILADQQAIEKAALNDEIQKVNVPRNWNFVMHVNKGSDTIAPDFAYDDGIFTYLGFNSTKTIPSVFLFDEANKESILNTHQNKNGRYDVLVIHKTAEKILLRSGNKLVGIVNQGYGKNPLDRTYDTTKQSVKREILE